MVVLRFKVQVQPDRVDEAVRIFGAVVAPSRAIDGVIAFDVARDVTDPNCIVVTEVFEDAAARERQESIPEVAAVMGFLPDALAAPPEATVYEVSSSGPAM